VLQDQAIVVRLTVPAPIVAAMTGFTYTRTGNTDAVKNAIILLYIKRSVNWME